MKKTDWYPRDIKPVRVGVYECEWKSGRVIGGNWFNYWDGEQWSYGYGRPDISPSRAIPKKYLADLIRWRGVMK